MDDPLIVLMSNNRVFRGLTYDELQDVRSAGNIRTYDAGSYIVHQGDPALAHYLLISGNAKLTQSTSNGRQMLARFLRPGDGFGIGAALEDCEYLWSAVAITDCQMLVLRGEQTAIFMKKYGQIAFNIMRVTLNRCRETQLRYAELLTFSVEQRLAKALLRLCSQFGHFVGDGCLIDLPLSREDLAEYTGTTVYSVSRYLQKWERNGVVRSGRERIVVLDPDALQKIVQATI